MLGHYCVHVVACSLYVYTAISMGRTNDAPVILATNIHKTTIPNLLVNVMLRKLSKHALAILVG